MNMPVCSSEYSRTRWGAPSSFPLPAFARKRKRSLGSSTISARQRSAEDPTGAAVHMSTCESASSGANASASAPAGVPDGAVSVCSSVRVGRLGSGSARSTSVPPLTGTRCTSAIAPSPIAAATVAAAALARLVAPAPAALTPPPVPGSPARLIRSTCGSSSASASASAIAAIAAAAICALAVAVSSAFGLLSDSWPPARLGVPSMPMRGRPLRARRGYPSRSPPTTLRQNV
mmetsp:Transcript_39763/g.98282  ORF Transcript_39763/g.98282 Transcript_39763/m.98282 type:complete len:232 (+) Transcript_39763:8202-8897(+)